MDDMPIIRLELDRMRQTMLVAFCKYSHDLEGKVDKALKDAIERFDFEAEIARMADGILREEIRKTLTNAFREIQYDRSLRDALVKAMIDEIGRSKRDSR